MQKIILLVLLALMPVALSACNTMEGVGQDMSKGGQAISRAAKDAQ